MPNWEPPDDDRSCSPFFCDCRRCKRRREREEREDEKWREWEERVGYGEELSPGELFDQLMGDNGTLYRCEHGHRFATIDETAKHCPACGARIERLYGVRIQRDDTP